MYAVGDKVVHPGYGPGVITAIERREVLAEAKRYYVIEMLGGVGTLMTPVAQADKVGLRLAVSGSSLERLLNSLTKRPRTLPADYRERQLEIEERLKQGDIFVTAKAIRDLAWYGHVHDLTRRDAQLMQRAEELLAAELALVEDVEIKVALDRVQTVVAQAMRDRQARQAAA
jgi:CarD family transcriptional regulator